MLGIDQRALTEEEARRVACRVLGSARVDFIGAGDFAACFGADDVVALVPRVPTETSLQTLRVAQACARVAREAGVRSPSYLRLGADPVPWAVCERVASDPTDAVDADELATQLERLHAVPIEGAGRLHLVDGSLAGVRETWSHVVQDFKAEWLARAPATPGALSLITAAEWELFSRWCDVESETERDLRLCHFDNRGCNLLVDEHRSMHVIDWDLARAAPPGFELIKLDEAGEARYAARYGSGAMAERLVAEARFGRVMDGVQMCVEWSWDPATAAKANVWVPYLKRVAAWLRQPADVGVDIDLTTQLVVDEPMLVDH
jgi:aminoglycoside phosphotransferase (APT) family kinase protein